MHLMYHRMLAELHSMVHDNRMLAELHSIVYSPEGFAEHASSCFLYVGNSARYLVYNFQNRRNCIGLAAFSHRVNIGLSGAVQCMHFFYQKTG